MDIVKPEGEGVSLGLSFAGADNRTVAIANYLGIGLSTSNRLNMVLQRESIPEEQIFRTSNWIFYVNSTHGYEGTFIGHPIDKRIRASLRSTYDVSSAAHKASLVLGEDGMIWLASDWDQEPKAPIPGLTLDDAKMLEEKLIAKENWHFAGADLRGPKYNVSF